MHGMTNEREDRNREDIGPGAERDREAGTDDRPDEPRDVAGDVDARRLEITPDREPGGQG